VIAHVSYGKMNGKYILKIKREKNDHKNMNMKYKSVRI